jgi:adhesin/invasin
MLKAAGSLLALLAVPFLTPLYGKNVVIFPYSSQSASVVVYTGEPTLSSSPSMNLTATAQPQYAAMNAAATKYYIGANSTTGTVSVLDATTGTSTKQFNFTSTITYMEMSPDGKRLIVFAGSLHVIDTTTDVDVTPSALGDLGTPVDNGIAIVPDGSRVLVLSSNKLMAYDLLTNAAVSTSLPFAATAQAVTAAPWCKAYVSAQGAIYEVETATMTITNTFTVTGLPGPVTFSTDGTMLIAANTAATSSTPAIYIVDRSSNTVSSGLNLPVGLEKLFPLSNGHLLAYSSTTQTIYDIIISSIALSSNAVAVWGNVTFSGSVRAIVQSDEEVPKYLYILNGSVLYQVDPVAGTITSQSAVSVGQTTRMAFVGAPSQNSPVNLTLYNVTQSVAVGGTPLPLVARVTDVNGKPVYNTSVNLASGTPELVLAATSATTNTNGYVRTTITTLPTVAGTFNVVAQVGSLSKTYTITVTSSGGSSGGSTGGSTTGTPGLSLYSGQGQVILQNSATYNVGWDPLGVQLRDASGAVVSGATITWTVIKGSGYLIGTAPFTTDANGVSQVNFFGNYISDASGVTQAQVTATYGTQTITFYVTILGYTPGANSLQMGLAGLLISPESRILTGQVGTTTSGAVQVRTTTSYGTPQLANVGLTIVNDTSSTTTPTASCSGGTVLTNDSGIGTCDVVFGGKIGTAHPTVRIGGYISHELTLVVTAGPPAQVVPISSASISGTPGQTLSAMKVEVRDSGGNALSGVAVSWTVVTANTVTLASAMTTTNTDGQASAIPTLGSLPGSYTVKVTAGTTTTVSYSFTVTINVTLGGLSLVSGNSQSAVVGNAFGNPLVVKAVNASGTAVQGLSVSWAISSGAGALAAGTSLTNSSGQASVTVQAGGTAGPLVVTASVSGYTVTFTLTVVPQGPSFTSSSIVNAASGQAGVTPGGLATITGTNLALNVTGGAVVANSGLPGKWPTTLSGVTVYFGTYVAPIQAVSNVNGVQSVTVQVPFEVSTGTTSVTISVSGGSTTVTGVTVKAVQPGLFETTDANGQKVAVLIRPDGSYVSSTNAAVRGENLRMLVTGLGQTSPLTATNQSGVAEQSVLTSLIAGVKGGGATVVNTEYAVGQIGVYIVTFQVPSDISAGTYVPVSLAAQKPDGTYENSNTSQISAVQ